jgi:hypothetical protein
MDNPDKLQTQDTGRRQTKQWTIQIDWQCTQDTGQRPTKQWTMFVFVLCLVLPVYLDCPLFCLSSSCILCWQFIWIIHCFVDKLPTQDTGRRQTTQWTIQINWQHKTQDEEKQNNG